MQSIQELKLRRTQCLREARREKGEARAALRTMARTLRTIERSKERLLSKNYAAACPYGSFEP